MAHSDRTHRILVRLAIVLTLGWVAWTIYDMVLSEASPYGHDLAAARKMLEDDQFEEALHVYQDVLDANPDELNARRGKAQALRQLGARAQVRAYTLEEEGDRSAAEDIRAEAEQLLLRSVAAYDSAILAEEARGVGERNRGVLGVSYANRGIAKDTLGDYQGALADYEKALELEPEVAEGPGWLTRFLRNQPEKPPSVKDRARYLREQLAKPPAERLLRVPAEDAKQRSYKM